MANAVIGALISVFGVTVFLLNGGPTLKGSDRRFQAVVLFLFGLFLIARSL